MLELVYIIAEFIDIVNDVEVGEGVVGSTPGGNGKDNGCFWCDLGVEVFQEG